MPSALTPLANITLSSSASTVTFSSISGSYRDLMLVMSVTMNSGLNTIAKMQFNNDTASNYSMIFAYGTGSSTGSTTSTDNGIYTNGVLGAGTSGYSMIVVNVMDYSATDKHKTVLSRDASLTTGVEMTAARWASTSAISTLVMLPTATTFAAGSTFALYGVSA